VQTCALPISTHSARKGLSWTSPMPQNLPVSRCGIFAESLRKSVSGLSRSVASFLYWVRISSAGRPRRELNYLEYHPTTFWRKIRGQTPKSPQLHFEFG